MSVLQESLEKQFHEQKLDDSLKATRVRAWDQFQVLGLPSKREDVWAAVKLRKLYEKELNTPSSLLLTREEVKSHLLPGYENSCIVFVNGRFQKELSSIDDAGDRPVLSSLEEATRTYGGFINHRWKKSLKEETDPFAILNAAFGSDGAFLYLPPKTLITKPIQVLFLNETGAPALFQPRMHLFAGNQSEVSLISTSVINSEGHLNNVCWDFSVEESSQVTLYQMNYGYPSTHWHLETVRAQIKRDSRFNTVNITDGSETVRNDYKVALLGENGEVNLSGLWMLRDKREAHTNILIDHQAPHCRSNQLFKGILDDRGRSSFEGKIYVHQAAQKTDAFQLNNNLLLSEGASADSKPNLEIFADDVKASHGSTVGQLDKEHLFYLKTRGYSHSEAQKILVRGYYQEILDQISIPELREKVDTELRC